MGALVSHKNSMFSTALQKWFTAKRQIQRSSLIYDYVLNHLLPWRLKGCHRRYSISKDRPHAHCTRQHVAGEPNLFIIDTRL